MMTEDELIERLADKEHASWARWQEYVLHIIGKHNADGSVTIPAERVTYWDQEIATPYADLPEQIKQYDREEVAHILPIIREYAAAHEQEQPPTPADTYIIDAGKGQPVQLWQTCPKCNGQKYVGVPPWVAGDALAYSTARMLLYTCPVCEGRGLVPMPIAGGAQ